MRYSPAVLLLAHSVLFGADVSHADFRAEAEAAYQRRDYPAAKAAIQSALALRPDSPRYLHHLAGLSALTGDSAAAIAALKRLASLGVSAPVERDPDLASLQGTAEYRAVLAVLAAHRAPQGEVEIIAELPGRTGILEGIVFRERTGDLFVGDVHHRCIWRRDRSGQVARFTAEDEELLGIFGLALDAPRQLLWAAMSAVPEMSGYVPELKGHAALAVFDLATSELLRVVHAPGDGRDHGLSDLTVGPDGTVYATDSKAPVVWKLAPDAEELEKVADSPAFGSLQGIVLEGRTLIVADYSNGLFTVDLGSGAINALATPPSTTLVGLDGLVAIPGGVIAVQNGVEPQRLLRITLAPALDAITGVKVLAAAHPDFSDLGLATLMNDRPIVVAGTGWERLSPGPTPLPAPHSVRLFQVALPVD